MNQIQNRFSLVSRLIQPGQSAQPSQPAQAPSRMAAPSQLFQAQPTAFAPDRTQLTQQPSAVTMGRIQRLLQSQKQPLPVAAQPPMTSAPSMPAPTPTQPSPLAPGSSLYPKARPVLPEQIPLPTPKPEPPKNIPIPTPRPDFGLVSSLRPKPRPAHLKPSPARAPAVSPPRQSTRGTVTSAKAGSINSWFVPQFSKGSINPNADCGPASVAMVLRAHGFAKNDHLGTVRRTHMKVSRNGATASDELARGIRNGSGGKLKVSVVEGNSTYRNDPKAMLERIKSELAAGKQVILLTKNMAKIARGDRSSKVNGHYVVVQKVNADNSLVVADPGSSSHGKNRKFSYAVFEKSFHARRKEGMPNNLLSVSR